MNKLTDALLIDLARHARTAGEVIVAEAAAQVPFRIERIFTLTAPAGAVRGRHAHRLCSQFMICVSGAVDVVCEDGNSKKTFAMNRRQSSPFSAAGTLEHCAIPAKRVGANRAVRPHLRGG